MKKIIIFFTFIALQGPYQKAFGMQQLPPSKHSIMRLAGNLTIGIAEHCAKSYIAHKALPYINSLQEKYPVLVPAMILAGSFGLQKLVEYQDRLIQIKTGKPSTAWAHIGSCLSSAKNIVIQNTITHALGSYISKIYQKIGSQAAIICNRNITNHPEACSRVAGNLGLTIAPVVATNGAYYLASKVSGNPSPQLRVKKSQLLPTKPPAPLKTEPSFHLISHLEGPQINYFLATHGCDIETLWHKFLPQAQQVQAFESQNLLTFCNEHLKPLRTSITHAFDATTNKLPTTFAKTTNPIEKLLDNAHMQFFDSPTQFKLNTNGLEQEKPYSFNVDKKPREFFNGVKKAVLSYFDQQNLQIRLEKGDEAIFNCPLTPIFYEENEDQVIITAYPQSRQDLLYPKQFEATPKLPTWFTIASKIIPYIPTAYNILCEKPPRDFLPNGSICANTNANDQTYCQLKPKTCFKGEKINRKESATCCLPDGGLAETKTIEGKWLYTITPNNGKINCRDTKLDLEQSDK